MIELQKFCSTDESRPFLHKPWRANGFIYATTGKIMIRVNSDVEAIGEIIDGTDKHPDCERLLVGFDVIQQWHIFENFPPCSYCNDSSKHELDCETCRGHGSHDCKCGDTHDCGKCHGKGKITTDCAQCGIMLGHRKFSNKLIRLVLSLPNPQFGLDSDEKEKITHFRFDGGVGIIVPLRQN